MRSVAVSSGWGICLALLSIASAWAGGQGALDTSFFGTGRQVVSFDPTEAEQAIGVVALPDGKTLAASAIQSGLNQTIALARFRDNGAADTLFGNSGIVRINLPVAYWREMKVGGDGKIVVVGTVVNSGSDYDMIVIRLLPDGSFDSTFAPGLFAGVTTVGFTSTGPTSYDYGEAVEIQNDGKIVVVGSATAPQFGVAVVRLNVNGSLDTSFSGDGKLWVPVDLNGGATAQGSSVTLAPAFIGTGDILVAGNAKYGTTGDRDFVILRVKPTGVLDTTFSGDGIATIAFDLGGNNVDLADSISVPITNDAILVAGSAADGASTSRSVVAKLKLDGSLDTTFASTGKLSFGIAGQPTGYDGVVKVLAAFDGRVTMASRSTVFAVTRLLPNGSFDPSYGDGSAGLGQVAHAFFSNVPEVSQATCMTVDAQGRLLVAGFVDANDIDTGVMRLVGDRIFANGFQTTP